jgi:hypothetical protein
MASSRAELVDNLLQLTSQELLFVDLKGQKLEQEQCWQTDFFLFLNKNISGGLRSKCEGYVAYFGYHWHY